MNPCFWLFQANRRSWKEKKDQMIDQPILFIQICYMLDDDADKVLGVGFAAHKEVLLLDWDEVDDNVEWGQSDDGDVEVGDLLGQRSLVLNGEGAGSVVDAVERHFSSVNELVG
jgi:hypothetical protein